jgi:uncharacterized protein YcbK (DUF882 family)
VWEDKMNEVFLKKVSRRWFLKTGSMAAISCFLPKLLLASPSDRLLQKKTLALYNAHTNEHLNAVFWSEGRYVNNALEEINYFLRDYRTGAIKPINKQLLNLISTMSAIIGTEYRFNVISGYRSPETNRLLRKKSKGVAKNSYHMFGKAIDIRVPGFSLSKLREIAVYLQSGGVGYYPKSNFIHIDSGPVRCW